MPSAGGDEPFGDDRSDVIHELSRGPWQGNVLNFSVTAREGRALVNFNWKSWLLLIKRLALFYLDIPSRLQGKPDNRMTLGRSLGGQLRHALMRRNIPLWLNSRLLELIVTEGAVTGAVLEREGQRVRPVSTHWVARWANSAADSTVSLCLMCSRWDSIVLMLRWRVAAIWRVPRP